MAIQKWSEKITVAELGDDPQLTEDLGSLLESLPQQTTDVVLNFAAVSFVNSSSIAKLLRLRKITSSAKCRLILAGVNTQVWGVLLVTGLDKVFEFTDDVATALATLQLEAAKGKKA